jgi:putative DNA methylase
VVQADWLKEHDVSDVPPGFLRPIAVLWTRTVTCNGPRCGATVPVIKRTWLCKKPGRYVALKMVAPRGKKGVFFEVVEARAAHALGFEPAAGPKGGKAVCPFCGMIADVAYVKTEGWSGRMGMQPMCLVALRPGRQGKVYLTVEGHAQSIASDENVRTRITKIVSSTGIP